MKDGILNKRFKYTFSSAYLYIIGANVLVYLATSYFSISIKGVPLVYWLSLIPSFVHHGCVWQFLTYMFVHGSMNHLFFNMLGLLMFGALIERSLGSREFLLFYFLTGILSGIISYVVYLLTGMANVALMGASGAIYSLLLLYAVLFPTARMLLFFFIPVKAPIAVLIFLAIELFSQMTGLSGGVAHLVHLAGIAVAWVYCLIRFHLNPIKVWKRFL